MDKNVAIYRKRYIPDETNYLKDDIIVHMDDKIIVTKWDTIKNREDIKTGMSIYFLDKGYKVSKMYGKDGETVYWYCDIVKINQDDDNNKMVCEDLLLDVVVYENGLVKVLDADELADALEKGIIPMEYGILALKNMNELLEIIYAGKFDEIKMLMQKYENA